MDDRPAEMYRRGRPVVEEFDMDEELYIRFAWKHFVPEENTILPEAIHVADQSANRSLFSSDPKHVLIPSWADHGVGILVVRDIPPYYEHPTDTSIHYRFCPCHIPEDDNYAHSEVRMFKNGVFDDRRREPARRVKKQYQTDLAMQIKVYQAPIKPTA